MIKGSLRLKRLYTQEVRFFITSALPVRTYDMNGVKSEVEMDKEWVQSDAGKTALGAAVKIMLNNEPRVHLVTKDIRAYLKSRGVALDCDSSSTKTHSPLLRDQDGIRRDYEAAQAKLFQALHEKDFRRVEEVEKRLQSLEQERKYLLQNPPDNEEPSSSYTRKLTNVVTFPLTLAYGMRKIFSQPMSQVHRISLNMVGPHITPSKDKTITQAWRMGGGCESGREVEVHASNTGKVLLHEHEDIASTLRAHDIFVLFNPGLGHSKLSESWRPTLSLLLQTRKPILCTALSRFDLLRDLEFIQQVSADEDSQELGQPLDILFQPELNPFRSEKRVFDEKEQHEDGKVAVANEFIYAFSAK